MSIYDAVIDMKDKGLCPVIAFHLDTFMALSLFKELLKVERNTTCSRTVEVQYLGLSLSDCCGGHHARSTQHEGFTPASTDVAAAFALLPAC